MTRVQVSTIDQAVSAIKAITPPFELRIPRNVSMKAFTQMLHNKRLGVSFADANYENANVIYVRKSAPKVARYWRMAR